MIKKVQTVLFHVSEPPLQIELDAKANMSLFISKNKAGGRTSNLLKYVNKIRVINQ